MIKPGFEKPISRKVFDETIGILEKLMVVLHPVMPFITEEVWQTIKSRAEGESVMVEKWPQAEKVDSNTAQANVLLQELVTGIRNLRSQQGLSPKDALEVYINSKDRKFESFFKIIQKIANVSKIEYVSESIPQSKSFIIGTDEIYIPVEMNVEEEIAKAEDELKRQKGFLIGVEKKLGNARFVDNAPAQVVEVERKKQADAQARIQILEQAINDLKAQV
jgi:valyl-tRNA synthetase